jgi:hypothetical protein
MGSLAEMVETVAYRVGIVILFGAFRHTIIQVLWILVARSLGAGENEYSA